MRVRVRGRVRVRTCSSPLWTAIATGPAPPTGKDRCRAFESIEAPRWGEGRGVRVRVRVLGLGCRVRVLG